MSENLRNLTESGVSIWLDDLSRDRLDTGNLADLIANSYVRGVTTNPAIFSQAISKSTLYRKDIHHLASMGNNVNQIVEELTTQDVRRACDLFLPIFNSAKGVDGRVSIEVEPNLAYETSATIARAKVLYQKVNRKNVLIKVPATIEGLAAIEDLILEGISINVTLIFSVERYLQVMESYLRGLEKRIARGLPIDQIHSVASFFISRIDSEVDKRLDKIAPNHPLRGKAALASGHLAYEAFQKVFTSNRWLEIARAGGNIQRALWASTGVKDPAYDKGDYVFKLVAKDSVNTMPQATLDYIRDNGSVPAPFGSKEIQSAKDVFKELTNAGIDLKEIFTLLENEGVEKFEVAWDELLETVSSEANSQLSLRGEGLNHFSENSKTFKDLVKVAPKILEKDATLWGKAAQEEAAIRLGWVDLPAQGTELLPQLTQLAAWALENNLHNVILCGMGGSSLAPEVFAKVYQKNLTVLDSTDPSQIALGTPKDLTNSVIIVSSKSGSTVETASQRAYFTEALKAQGLNPANHFVIVTDPGSPLDQDARKAGLRVINANPNVGGRYSALSAFGLTPATLLGIDVKPILESAANTLAQLAEKDSPAIKLATIITDFDEQNLAFVDAGSPLPGIADWIEQLIAESTGKSGKGRLPIVIESNSASIAGKALKISFDPMVKPAGINEISVIADLGSQFIFWEFLTALLGKSLKVDPFNQPNVTEAKERSVELLNNWANEKFAEPDYVDQDLEIYGAANLADVASKLDGHYLAIMAYLNRIEDSAIAQLREKLAKKLGIGVTFGWGPRFLHSTGQFHKGGQPNGAFLQITSESKIDISIPGKDFTFHRLIMAQALGDAKALTSRKYPLVRIHLKNRDKGIARILKEI